MTGLQAARGRPAANIPSLVARPTPASVITACLDAQAEAPERTLLGKVFGTSPLSDESRKWYAGALGELRVAEELAKLGPSWVVLHSVPVGEHGRLIDHLAIGPGGVFAITVLHDENSAVWASSDSITVNGAERGYILASRDAATDAAVTLTRATGFNVPVYGLLVFIAPYSLTADGEFDDVGITTDRALHKWLTGVESALDEDKAVTVAEVAIESSTWRAGATTTLRAQAFDPAPLDDLRAEVQRAWLTRAFWGAAAVAAATIGLVQFLAT
ncbi:MAG TPA: nuclease-related domain-containing protein [Gryllotalpicola sp.]